MFGIININKPENYTSHDVVAKLRKILGIKKIGHTGTLDPIATGVLPVCIGKATRLIQYLDDTKAYKAFLRLGIRTDTFDISGKILEKNTVDFNPELIKKYLEDFKGEIIQTPPMYSAIHYKGKRLYEYARKNIEIDDIPTRKITVNSLEIDELKDIDTKNPLVILNIDCSSGTYIRSIISDLGNKLGYGATMENLIRTRAGKFRIEESFTLEDIAELAKNSATDRFLISPLNMTSLDIFSINQEQLDKIIKGQYFHINDNIYPQNSKILLEYQGKPCSVGEVRENKIYPINVLI
jgi:tRNA pseudouridine55 synthase